MLELVTAPATEVVTLAEVKAELRITSSSKDALIQSILNTAIDFVDGQGALGGAMITQTWRQYIERNPSRVKLKMPRAIALTAVGYYDADNSSQTATLADFELLGSGLNQYVQPVTNAVWPTAYDRPDAIWVEYSAGYGATAADVPNKVKKAITRLAVHWYLNPSETSEKQPFSVPFGFWDLINCERGNWYA